MKCIGSFVAKLLGKNSIGIDFADGEINMVHLRKFGKTYQVVGYKSFDDLEQSPNFVELKHEIKNAGAKIAIALPDSQVLHKEMLLDGSLTESEIKNFLLANVQKIIGLNGSDVCFDFTADYAKADEQNKLAITATFVRKSDLDAKIELCSSAGLKVSTVAVESSAVAELLRFNIDNGAVLNCRKKNATLFIFDNKRVVVVKEFAELSFSAQLLSILSQELTLLSTMHQISISKLFLAGELPKAEELTTIASEDIKIPIEVIKPFQNFLVATKPKFERQGVMSRMLVATGLALGGFGSA